MSIIYQIKDNTFTIQILSPEFPSKKIKIIIHDKQIKLLLENNWVIALFILELIANDRCSKNIHFAFI